MVARRDSLLATMLMAFWSAGAIGQDVPQDPPEGGGSVEEVIVEVDPGPPAATAADLEALRLQLDALRGLVEKQGELIDSQGEKLSQQNLRLLAADDLKFDLEGYYRTRGYVFRGLFASQGESPGTYMQHRLRVRTTVAYRELAKFSMDFNALDNVVWGDNQSLTDTALFAGSPSGTNLVGVSGPSFSLFRAWMEFSVPLGKLRIGRQPSHWGMGLLANDGDGFRNDFGEAFRGNTFDRVLFATNPVSIVQAIVKSKGPEVPLFIAFGVDRLVEDPLIQYYGYQCEPGLVDGDDDFDSRCDQNGDGVTEQDHGFTQDREGENRDDDWWADLEDDVFEFLYVIIYRGEDLAWMGGTGDLTAGAYVVHRLQQETDSNVLILDAYLNTNFKGFFAEAEGVIIVGKTKALALPGVYDPSGSVDDPLAKQALIGGYVVRLGYETPRFRVLLEQGMASGDNNVADENFTGRPLHSDHNVGLLLYEEVISRVTANLWSDAAEGLWSKGGVYNSIYINPRVSVYPLDNWEIIAGFLTAFPHQPDGRFIRCAEGDAVECAQYDATSPILGYEFDLGVHHRFHKHVLFAMEAAYAKGTDRLPLEAAGLNPDGHFFTFQSRIAYEF